MLAEFSRGSGGVLAVGILVSLHVNGWRRSVTWSGEEFFEFSLGMSFKWASLLTVGILAAANSIAGVGSYLPADHSRVVGLAGMADCRLAGASCRRPYALRQEDERGVEQTAPWDSLLMSSSTLGR